LGFAGGALACADAGADAGAPNLLRLGCSIPKRRKSAEVLGFDEARVAGDA